MWVNILFTDDIEKTDVGQIGSYPQVGVKVQKHLKPPPRLSFGVTSAEVAVYFDVL